MLHRQKYYLGVVQTQDLYQAISQEQPILAPGNRFQFQYLCVLGPSLSLAALASFEQGGYYSDGSDQS